MTTIRDFNQSPTSASNSGGTMVIDSFEPYTIDTPLPFGNVDFPEYSIFTKSVYGVTGEALGFGDGGFGIDNYMKLDKFKLEYDFESRIVYLIVPTDYIDEYKLEEINEGRLKLYGIDTQNEFLILRN